MKKALSLVLALALCLCLGSAAFAAGSTVTLINGMDGSVHATYQVADGEDFVFTISCAAPCDMGPIASGEMGSGVTTTDGAITYSNITLGGPNQYPTAETVTVSGFKGDITVTVTPNPLETGSQFPTITEGEAAGGSSGEASSGEPSGEASDEAVWDAYVEYLHDFLVNTELPVNTGGMTLEIIENEFMPMIREGNFADPPAALLFNGLLDSGVAMTYEEFAAQYQPAGALSAEDAYIEYIHDFLLNELTVNTGGMTLEIIENEFMPAVKAGKYDEFPADMLYNGMLDSGVAMTFEEFAAQYKPAAGAGDTSKEAYHAYLKEYVDAVPAVDDEAFQVFSALIDADDYTTMPADMLFNAQWWGYAAMTYDEFVAAGGVYEIPAFDPNLKPD